MAKQDPNQDRQAPIVAEPGDTNSADIVGRTGEQMPVRSHDGIEANERPNSSPASWKDEDDLDGHPV